MAMTPEERKERKREYNRKYYEANREAIEEQKKEYREANRETIVEYRKKYREANRETIAEKQKAYHEANRETILEKQKTRYEANRESLLEKQKAYNEANREVIAERRKVHYEANRETILEMNKVNYESRRLKWLQWFSDLGKTRCAECGYNKCFDAIDFHHSFGRKEITVGAWLLKTPSQAHKAHLAEELKGGRMLCSRCHMIEHTILDAFDPEFATKGSAAHHHYQQEWNTWINQTFPESKCCVVCGWDGAKRTIDWHHRDPNTKEYVVATITRNKMTPERQARYTAEVAKCIRLCRNCHREYHAGLIELPN